MKKTLVIIFSIVLCIALAGAAVALGGEDGIIKKDEATSAAESEKNNSAQKTEENAEKIIVEETETLSAEDKALKAEIAKISDTKIDFRTQRQDKIGNKTYNISYKEISSVSTTRPRIIYTSKLEDGTEAKFTYHIDNGELLEASVGAIGAIKSEKTVSFEEAQKIASNIAEQYCDTSVYQLSLAEERQFFYEFTFSRFISGIESSEGVYLIVEFDGTISYLRVCTDVFSNKNIIIDENKLTTKLEDELNASFPSRKNYTIDKKRIGISNGKPVVEYYVIIQNEDYSSNFIFEIPIE